MFGAFLLVLLAGWPALRALQGRSGQMWLADLGVASAQQWTRGHVERTLLEALETASDFVDSVRIDAGPAGRVHTVSCQVNASLLDLNILLTSALERAGVHIQRGSRTVAEGGETLELLMGTSQQVTHRLVATRGNPQILPPALPSGRLALVIDDFGHNLDGLARRLLTIDAPLTIAILPELRYSKPVLAEAHRVGKHALLHMPMEPDDGAPVPPGEPCVWVGMSTVDVRSAVTRALDGLPGVVGLNNHMGSRATRYQEEMKAVVDVVAERGLVFLDSQTTSGSVAWRVARERGVPCLRSDLFLDVDTEDPEVVWERLEQLLQLARDRGWAVGIGHVNPATVAGIERLLGELHPDDVQLVSLVELMYELTPTP
jgi:polysaccharide deacetylase 2 family uncharacterized protein YibQ